MNTKCILFDADGVVINSEKFSAQYQKKFGVSNDEMLPFFKGIFQYCLIGKADLKEVVQPYLEGWKWNGSVDEFLHFWFKAEHKVNDKIISLIKRLRGNNVKCYLATNQEKYRNQYMKNEMRFSNLFDAVYSSAEIGYKKPEREFYEFVYNDIKDDLSISKGQILYIDDTPSHIEEAKKFGIDAHFYENFEKFKKLIEPLLYEKVLF